MDRAAMRAARALLSTLFLLLVPVGCDDDDGNLSEDTILCDEPADCADLTDEGGMCCSGICVDCWSDADADGTFDCSDPDYQDGICLAD